MITSILTPYTSIIKIGDDSFSGILRKVVRSNETAPDIYPNLELMMEKYPLMNKVGAVEGVCLEGSTLWYQKIPETLIKKRQMLYAPALDISDTA